MTTELITDTQSQTITSTESRALHTFTVFPDDLNYAGSLFGGKLLAEMDIAAIKPVRRLLYGTDCDAAVTASVDRVDFLHPASLGDIIDLQAEIVRLGRTSIDVTVHVTKEDQSGHIAVICDARFTFVSLKDQRPYPHHFTLLNTRI